MEREINVMHVDGLDWRTTARSYEVSAGTSLRDAFDKLGATVWYEKVKAPPRPLPDDVARFIAKYEPDEPPSALAVFRCYGWLDAEEFDTAEEAQRYIANGEEEGRFAGEAVVASDGTITVCD